MRSLVLSWGAGTAAAVAVVAMLVSDAYVANLVHLVAIAALMAASMRFVMLIGELNFASSAFVGVGAYGAGIATTVLDLPFPVAMLLGPAAVLAFSVLFGFITLRARGPYFMLIGFAFSEAVRIALSKVDAIGGSAGMIGIFPPRSMEAWFPAFTVGCVALLLFALHAAERSDFGKALVAIRDNEDIARTVGINVLAYKVACLAIASVCAGVAGSLFAFVNTVISPGDFNFLLAGYALAYVKVGGEFSIFGAMAGAVFLTLASSYALSFGTGQDFIYGGAIFLTMLLLPRGIVGTLGQRLRLRAPARHAAAVVPGPVAPGPIAPGPIAPGPIAP